MAPCVIKERYGCSRHRGMITSMWWVGGWVERWKGGRIGGFVYKTGSRFFVAGMWVFCRRYRGGFCFAFLAGLFGLVSTLSGVHAYVLVALHLEKYSHILVPGAYLAGGGAATPPLVSVVAHGASGEL